MKRYRNHLQNIHSLYQQVKLQNQCLRCLKMMKQLSQEMPASLLLAPKAAFLPHGRLRILFGRLALKRFLVFWSIGSQIIRSLIDSPAVVIFPLILINASVIIFVTSSTCSASVKYLWIWVKLYRYNTLTTLLGGKCVKMITQDVLNCKENYTRG